ncbi:Predicted dehydrogenases and related proteins OS=Chthonomonas calidirosea (strain DSM 23976 / ICMP 18418 / T49) GN=CCALI_02134 PE=4 SV=1 [Gemmataceae bacterium]|nr:Predicted dehydrogenases and related proteins OS=Chthonomonas calidirosea (strain DSM 23976 / ICMP 18418 / T49) GN=CCALI_02134 PE=4 SV=1 [Gemmataceae bacterium]VTT98235.1 Predicted dehydrogenases and related proteins OS=Chthonomonas calidirosea (strain DSM 23976 / ICMP 18418 / T49) GN=CCALI_02134 PE=4 SV=1 [Gemmataceae bacterium]
MARGRAGERLAAGFLGHPAVAVREVAGVRVKDKSVRASSNWKAAASRWLAEPAVDAVAVSVPGRWSLGYAFAALQNGKDVYLDPIRGYASDDLAELRAVAGANGRVASVACSHRSNTAVQDALGAVRSGAIGVVRSVRAVCLRGPGDAAAPFGSAAWSARVVRALDLGVWALGDARPERVFVAGFTSRPQPAAALPESAAAVFTFGTRTLVLEQSAVSGPLPEGIGTGVVVDGTAGRLVCDGESAVLFTPEGAVARRFAGESDPVGSFARAVVLRECPGPGAWSGAASLQAAAAAYRSAEPVTGDLEANTPPAVAQALLALRTRLDPAALAPSVVRAGGSRVV